MGDGLSSALATTIAGDIVASSTNVKLHTGAPGAAGTSNASSVTTRPAVTWAAASAGSVSANGTAPAWTSWAGTNGEVDTDVSFWDASSSGNFQFSATLSSSVTMNTGDSLTLTAITVSVPVAS
jgi:hypothetical protein